MLVRCCMHDLRPTLIKLFFFSASRLISHHQRDCQHLGGAQVITDTVMSNDKNHLAPEEGPARKRTPDFSKFPPGLRRRKIKVPLLRQGSVARLQARLATVSAASLGSRRGACSVVRGTAAPRVSAPVETVSRPTPRGLRQVPLPRRRRRRAEVSWLC